MVLLITTQEVATLFQESGEQVFATFTVDKLVHAGVVRQLLRVCHSADVRSDLARMPCIIHAFNSFG
jgi:hypothetical protein